MLRKAEKDYLIERDSTSAYSRYEIALEQLEESHRPPSISCRNNEKERIKSYINDSIAANGSSETLYISGVPGIGKTLCVQEIVQSVLGIREHRQRIKYAYINAMQLRRQRDFFRTLLHEFCGCLEDTSMAMYILNEFMETGRSNYDNLGMIGQHIKILVIDQIDCLLTRDEEVLYTILEWTQRKKSRLIMIAISNTIDFPESLSTKLSSRIGSQRLIFKPYTSDQIRQILLERVQHLQLFEPNALEYMGKRIARCSSDIRKCLQILRQAITEHNQIEGVSESDQVSLATLIKVHDKVYEDALSQHYGSFHESYKQVLKVLATYFSVETRSCTFRELEARCGSFLRRKNQLQSVLMDLRDLGLISIRYGINGKDGRLVQDFQNIKQLEEQHINLLVEPDSILFAAKPQLLIRRIKHTLLELQ